MKAPVKHALAFVVIATSVGLMLFIIVLLQAQQRSTAEANQSLIREVKAQTDINQRFLRCILLLERERFNDVESRIVAIDECTIESRSDEEVVQEQSPERGSPTTTPRTEQREQSQAPAQPRTQSAPRQQSTPQQQQAQTPPPASQPEQPQPEPEQGIVSRVVETVRGLF